jgi:DNA processing protein
MDTRCGRLVSERPSDQIRSELPPKSGVGFDMEHPEPARSATVERAPLKAATEQLAFLALASIRGVGYWTLAHMASAGVGFSEFLRTDSSEEASSSLRRFGARLENKADANWREVRDRALDRAARALEQLSATGTRIVMVGDAGFPKSLKDLPDPPAWLFIRGNQSILGEPSLAAVGTREPSDDGMWLCRFVGLCFEHWQSPTVSGLATGVDQIVHEMSLRARVPTIAVLGTGIFSDYPKASTSLRERILDQGGSIITEYLPNDSYSAENFVRRNRLQAALGRVLIPIEWAARSGTAHTVRYAGKLGRPIAGLRLPDWPGDRVIFANGAAKTAATFTIPGQEEEFRRFVAQALGADEQRTMAQQLTLI